MTLPLIAAVIPTRDRTALAMEAVRSLLVQECPIEIFVSDNSNFPNHELADFCRGLGDRVRHMHPPESLHQAGHWDWAIRQAMRGSAATHFTVHYDRKLSKPNQLGHAQALAARWPETLVCWPHDYVAEVPPPMRLWQPPWTGNVYELRTARFVQLTAEGRASALYSQALPLLSNCLVPRSVLTAVVEGFGDLCDSTTPDTCFAFRFAALFDRYLHLDRPLGILHAPHRSSGSGYLRGSGSDWTDFQKAWGDRPWLEAAPLPGVNLGLNMLYHEYELVRRAAGDRLPALDFPAYLDDLATGLPLVRDARARAVLRRLLEEKGWRGGGRWRPIRGRIRHGMLGLLDRHLGVRLPFLGGRVFDDDREALRHALAHPRPPRKRPRHLALLDPVQIG